MRTTLDYLNAAKAKLGIASDRALAHWLGLSQPAVAQYQGGKRIIDNYAATKIAQALGIDPLEVIARAEFEREKQEGRKKYWENFSQEIAGPASPSISRTGGGMKGRTAATEAASSPKTTLDYLDAAAERLDLASDPALARWLGVDPETLANCRKGTAALDDYAAAKLADALGLDPLEVIAVANLERSQRPEEGDYWRKIFQRCAAALIVFFLYIPGGWSATAENSSVSTTCTLCAICSASFRKDESSVCLPYLPALCSVLGGGSNELIDSVGANSFARILLTVRMNSHLPRMFGTWIN